MTDAPALALPFDVGRYDAEPIRTARLLLRPLRESDGADVWEYQRDDEVLRYIPWPARTREQGLGHTAWRAAARVMKAHEDAVFFAVELVGEPSLSGSGDRVIGDVMLRLESADAAGIEIGWVFDRSFQGRGYASEAAAAVLAVAFEALGAHRVMAQLDPRNEASARLCSRLGMRHEGTTIESYWDKGEFSDGAIWAVLRREWAAQRT